MALSIPNLQISFENPNFVESHQCGFLNTLNLDFQPSQTLTPVQFDHIMETHNDTYDPDGFSVHFPQSQRLNRTSQEEKKHNREKKLRVLVETLKPVPFVPSESLDFTRHESLLRRLGLWDFVHVEFDRTIRCDLLAQLVSSYTPNSRGDYGYGYVNGVKILVNREELGRALKLPMGRSLDTENKAMMMMMEKKVYSAESIAFVDKLMSVWMVLHDEDACVIMPPEVLSCTKLIMGGNFEKIDWAGLVWKMVEKELQDSRLESCYYASHLQLLIKTQHEDLLTKEFYEVDSDSDSDSDEQSIELSLEKSDVQVLGFEGFKEEEPDQLWPFLQQCNFGDDELRGLEEEKEIEHACSIPLMGISSGSFLQAEEQEMPSCSGVELGATSVGDNGHKRDIISHDDDDHYLQHQSLNGSNKRQRSDDNLWDKYEDGKPVDFNMCNGQIQMGSGLSLLGNGHNRDITHDDDDHCLQHQSLNGSNKRQRSDNNLWDEEYDDGKLVDFNMCMEHVNNWIGNARMVYAAKEQAHEESSMNHQFLLNELQEKNRMIEHLRQEKLEESHKRQMEVNELKRQLIMMSKLVEGYRDALKETNKSFCEYRALCPQASEPIYKDVPTSFGPSKTTFQ